MFVKEKIPLKSYSTIEIGGPAKYLVEAFSVQDFKEALLFARERQIPYFVVGRGSNTLFDDQGFEGLVIVNRYFSIEEMASGQFLVGSGTSLPLLSMKTATHGWGGLEWALGIPGSVGGAVAMNAGASKSEISETIEEVLFCHSTGEEEWIAKKDLKFTYRNSSFHTMDGVILAVKFKLHQNPEARSRQLALFGERRKTQPYDEPSLGCIFQNPIGQSCGKLIDELGLKGLTMGGARISPLHGNFITNPSGGSSKDVLALISTIENEIRDKKNLELKKEIKIVTYTL